MIRSLSLLFQRCCSMKHRSATYSISWRPVISQTRILTSTSVLEEFPDAKARPLDEDSNPLANGAARCVDNLNTKYECEKGRLFFLLHRHRVFNSRQGVWMGWERKRGKLLDLNKLLLGKLDSFPLKADPRSPAACPLHHYS